MTSFGAIMNIQDRGPRNIKLVQELHQPGGRGRGRGRGSGCGGRGGQQNRSLDPDFCSYFCSLPGNGHIGNDTNIKGK